MNHTSTFNCPFASFALDLAQVAVALIRSDAIVSSKVIHKSPGDFASELDSHIESVLKSRISDRFPSHSFLGEETGGDIESDAGDPDVPIWIVDPIDGSVNFVRGYPQYSVSIALVVNGEPIAACIADPFRGEFFVAAIGHGAFLNGQRIEVARTANFKHAIAATVFPKPNAVFMDSYMHQFNHVIRAVAGVRRAGSMALELAYLAAGRVDLFWERGMGAWDAAAGVLLIREAGGEVFTMDGKPWISSSEICASIPALLDDWRSLIDK